MTYELGNSGIRSCSQNVCPVIPAISLGSGPEYSYLATSCHKQDGSLVICLCISYGLRSKHFWPPTLIRGDEGGFDPKLHKYLFQKISTFSSEEKGGKSLSNQETHKGWLLSHPPPHWSLQKPDLPKRKRKTARLAGSVGRFSRVTSLPQLETSVHSNPKSVPIPLPWLGPEDCPALSFCTLSANNKQKVYVQVWGWKCFKIGSSPNHRNHGP